MFACLVRVPASALRHLRQLLIRGFYAEPRAPGGSAPHAGFAVVWLPEADYPKALHVLRTCPQAVALTRLGKRYGVRCREADEQLVHQTLRPGSDFQKIKITAHWHLHPLPFGCQRKHLQGLLKSWAWSARPLQPARGNGEGAAWIVGAAEDPPAWSSHCMWGYLCAGTQSSRHCCSRAPDRHYCFRPYSLILYDDGEEGPSACLARPPPGLPPPAAPASSGTQTKITQLREELSQGMKDLVQQHLTASNQADTQKSEALVSRNSRRRTPSSRVGSRPLVRRSPNRTTPNRTTRLRLSSSLFRHRRTTLPSFVLR